VFEYKDGSTTTITYPRIIYGYGSYTVTESIIHKLDALA